MVWCQLGFLLGSSGCLVLRDSILRKPYKYLTFFGCVGFTFAAMPKASWALTVRCLPIGPRPNGSSR